MAIKNIGFYLVASITVLLMLPQAPEAISTGTESPEIAGFVIIGELENITFKAKDLNLQARIDTGAQTSSLGVASQQPFERDGKKWLVFTVNDPHGNKSITFEKPIKRIAKIKRHGGEALERAVVKLKILLGNTEMEREFTLADRSQYKYPVLIGRNVLRGKYLVDVNRRFTSSQKGEREE